MPQANPRVPAAIGLLRPALLLRPGRNEALGVVVIMTGAKVVIAGAVLMAFRRGFLGAPLDEVAEGAPLLRPGVRLVLARAQPLADAVDFLERHHAVRPHALDDERGVRPEKVVAEVIDPRTARRHLFWLDVLRVDEGAPVPDLVRELRLEHRGRSVLRRDVEPGEPLAHFRI